MTLISLVKRINLKITDNVFMTLHYKVPVNLYIISYTDS